MTKEEIKSLRVSISSSIEPSDGYNTASVRDPMNEDRYCSFCGEKITPKFINDDNEWYRRCSCPESISNMESVCDLDHQILEINGDKSRKNRRMRNKALVVWKKLYEKSMKSRDEFNQKTDKEILSIEADDIWNWFGETKGDMNLD